MNTANHDQRDYKHFMPGQKNGTNPFDRVPLINFHAFDIAKFLIAMQSAVQNFTTYLYREMRALKEVQN